MVKDELSIIKLDNRTCQSWMNYHGKLRESGSRVEEVEVAVAVIRALCIVLQN